MAPPWGLVSRGSQRRCFLLTTQMSFGTHMPPRPEEWSQTPTPPTTNGKPHRSPRHRISCLHSIILSSVFKSNPDVELSLTHMRACARTHTLTITQDHVCGPAVLIPWGYGGDLYHKKTVVWNHLQTAWFVGLFVFQTFLPILLFPSPHPLHLLE